MKNKRLGEKQGKTESQNESQKIIRADSRIKNRGESRFEAVKEAFGFDKAIFASSIVLAVVGIIFIYSASNYSAQLQYGDSLHYVKTQSVALLLGCIAMFCISFVPMEKVNKARFMLLGIGFLLLAMVFVPLFGVESYGAKRWLNLGFSTIQPSEYAKFALIIYIAAFMSKYGCDKFSRLLIPLSAGGLMCVMLLLEPNMSITVCVGLVTMLMLFVGGAKVRHLLLILLPAVAAAIALILIEPYRVKRLFAFIDPWASSKYEGYQLIQSYYSLGAGGLFGVGMFNSRQKYLFLPFAESDFIVSVIGEEMGFFGCLALLMLFIVLIWRGIVVAVRAKDRFSSYTAAGITAMIAVQTAVNIAVVCGAIPPTGLPLPYVSAGGSSLVAYMCASGLLLAISRGCVHKGVLKAIV